MRTDFQRSGLAHLLAASGANVMLLATLVLGARRRGRRCRCARGCWRRLLLVALYVPLAGGGPSIQRAGVMGAAGLVAALAGRPSSRWYAVGLAAAATLSLNPRAASDPGWQLSFAAVLALLALAPAAARRARSPPAGPRGGRGGDHDRGDDRHRAAAGVALRAGLARLAAREPAGGAGGGADHVARHARGGGGPGVARARGAADRPRRAAARRGGVARARGRLRAARGAAGAARLARCRSRSPAWSRSRSPSAPARCGGAGRRR